MSAPADPLARGSDDPPLGRLCLTERELVVLQRRQSGASWNVLADELGLSRSTIRSAWASARRKILLAKEGDAA